MSLINKQAHLHYDGSFEGFLSVVYMAYELKLEVLSIQPKREQLGLFLHEWINIETNEDQAKRVFNGVKKKYGKVECKNLYKVFLTEDSEGAFMLYKYIRKLFDESKDWRSAYQCEEVLYVQNQLKKMRREVHRMHAFVRFQQTKDDLYFSVIAPDFNVIPFIGDHFKKRYSDQHWLIFDKRRAYGVHYDKQQMEYFSWADEIARMDLKNILASHELAFEEWWRSYFKATNIQERKNMKLHLRHVPKRYWKYLTEKQ